MSRTIIVATFASALALVAAAGAHAEVDPAPYGGGQCHQMAGSHDPAALWVGRFVGIYSSDGAGSGAYHDIACFTDHKRCMDWVNRDSGQGVDRIIQMSCHQGLTGSR